MAPIVYDANSPEEYPVPLPSAPLVILSENAVLQPPLTRRGTGPGMVIFLPPTSSLNISSEKDKPLDPKPVQKWAEEGFTVVGVTIDGSGWSAESALNNAVNALLPLDVLSIKDKFAVLVYDPSLLTAIASVISNDPRLVCLAVYASPALFPPQSLSTPLLVHLATGAPDATNAAPTSSNPVIHSYTSTTSSFVLPHVVEYNPGHAALAHTRTLVFLRKWIGGPIFDIEAIWEEHTYFEFEVRSVAKTMGTMVAEPYVNHVPTMTGGIGRENLTAFYRDHFIFANPADANLQVVSRTVGPDRVVDEFIYNFTHDRIVDWLMPGVPPTGKKMSIPMMAVVNVRGDRLYNEHIWWDQGTALFQAGIISTHVPYPALGGSQVLRLPVAGAEAARMLVDESKGKSNEMFGSDWGVQEK